MKIEIPSFKIEIRRKLLLLKKRIREKQYRRRGIVRWRDPVKKAALTAKRDAMKQNAMPKWADKDRIDDIYAVAAMASKITGIKHEVDHIVPLLSHLVCGLHWEGNLRVLTKAENVAKKNHFNPEDPEGLAFLKANTYTPRQISQLVHSRSSRVQPTTGLIFTT